MSAQIDLNAVTVFCSVVKHGSFSAAARELRVSPSHVSRTVSGLEDALGVRLFQRTTRKIVLTEPGHGYFERVDPMLEELRVAADRMRDEGETPRGLVRLATPTSFACEHVVPWLEELRALHPMLTVQLLLDSRMSDLVEERIDLAIRLGRPAPSTLIARKLCAMPRVVVASPRYLDACGRPATPEDVPNHDCLVFPFEGYGASWRFRDSHGRIHDVNLTPTVTIPEGLALRALALRHLGLTLLPRWLVADELHRGTLVDVFPNHDVTGTVHDAAIWLVYPSREYLPLKVRVIVDFVMAKFRDGPPWERFVR